MRCINLLNKLADFHVKSEQNLTLEFSNKEGVIGYINKKINIISVYIIVKFSKVLAYLFDNYSNLLKEKQKKICCISQPKHPLVQLPKIKPTPPDASLLQPPINSLPKKEEGELPIPNKLTPPFFSQPSSVILRMDEMYQQANKEFKQGHIEKAKELFKSAADLKHISSNYMLGEIYSKEMDTILLNHPKGLKCALTEEFKNALNLSLNFYEQAAQYDHKDAMVKLGKLYFTFGMYYGCEDTKEIGDFDLPKSMNYKELGEHWINKAGNAGHKDALLLLGNYYTFEKQYEKSRAYYEKAADEGIADASYKLGWIYQNGLGCDVNKKTAISHYLKAAKLGNAEAKFRIGLLINNNEANKQKAISYIVDAADGGCAKAAAYIGNECMNCAISNNNPESYLDAIFYLEKAAHQDDKPSIVNCIEVNKKLAELFPEESQKYLAQAEKWQAIKDRD
jgi:TPR repeat protein